MTLLDRHLLAQYTKAALFALLTFCVIFVLIDMVENLDDFLDENVPTHMIALYYAYFLPRIFNLMIPIALLLAALFTVGRMSNRNELTVIRCCGISLYRFMAPLVAVGLLASLGMLWFDGWMVPRINAQRVHIERVYMKKGITQGARYNVFFQDVGNRIVSLEYFEEQTATARRVSIQKFERADPTILERRIDAEYMRWDTRHQRWRAFRGVERRFTTDPAAPGRRRETVTRFDSIDVGTLVITPAIIVRMQMKPEEMALGDFRDYIERQRVAGSDIARLRVDYLGKIAFPFSSLIVIFFGVPFASVKRRSGLSVQFGVSILICFIYLVSQKISQVFGYNGSIPAWLAAWLPNLLFAAAGMFVILRVRK
jgi:lipopolysaccharide export system permease protein